MLRSYRAELDTANKATELSDFSVSTTWGVKGKDLFLLAVFRRRLEYPALKRAVREQLSLFDARVVLVEDKASGTQLIQELIADGCYGVTRFTSRLPTRSCVLIRRPSQRSARRPRQHSRACCDDIAAIYGKNLPSVSNPQPPRSIRVFPDCDEPGSA